MWSGFQLQDYKQEKGLFTDCSSLILNAALQFCKLPMYLPSAYFKDTPALTQRKSMLHAPITVAVGK